MAPTLQVGILALVVLVGGCGSKAQVNGPSVAVLRKSIGSLADVSAFAVLSGAGPQAARQSSLTAESADGGAGDGGSGPRLVALTLSGEVLDISLVEEGNPRSTGVLQQPRVEAIYPTASWLLFTASYFKAYQLQADGGSEAIGCSTIAARRADGALFCADLMIRYASDNSGPLYNTVQANAAGDVAYAAVGDFANNTVVYKLDLGRDGGPSAALVDPSFHPTWFLANAEGDLLINYFPSILDQSSNVTQIIPVDGGSAFTVAGTHNSYAIAGAVGSAAENSFYLTSGGGGGWPFDGTLRFVSKSGPSFVETPHVITRDDMNQYSALFPLAGSLYMFNRSAMALLPVIANGAVVPNPVPIVLSGVDHLIDVGGAGAHPAGGKVVFLASTGSGYKFVRHDGTTQQDIPLDPNLELVIVTVSSSGIIDFLAVRKDTKGKVRGSVAAGSLVVTTIPAGVLDPAQLVVFTRIN